MSEFHPVEVFLEREEAVAFIKRWTGEYPSNRVRIFRCPISSTDFDSLALTA